MIGWLDGGERRRVEMWPGVNHYCFERIFQKCFYFSKKSSSTIQLCQEDG